MKLDIYSQGYTFPGSTPYNDGRGLITVRLGEETINAPDAATLQRLDHDLMVFEDLVILDGATPLVANTDYTPGPENEEVSAIIAEARSVSVDSIHVVRGVYIVTPAYWSTDLTVSGIYAGDEFSARELNEVNGTPLDADPIDETDILIADGTPSPAVSNGTLPISGFDRFTWIPSQIELENTLIDNPDVKWPGIRGMKGAFGEYENQIDQNLESFTANGTATTERSGNWIEINNGATPVSAYISQTASLTGSFFALYRLMIKNIDAVISNLGAGGAVSITWATKSVSMSSPYTEISSNFLTDDILELIFWVDHSGSIGFMDVYPDRSNADRSVQVKDLMIVDFGSITPTKFPYVEGIHQADNLTYYHDWGQQGTIEFWAEINQEYDMANYMVFLGAQLNGTDNRVVLFYDYLVDKITWIVRNTTGTDFSFTTDAYTGGTWIQGIHHFKLTYDFTTASNNKLYIDAVDHPFTTAPILSGTFDIQKDIEIGKQNSSGNPIYPLQGLIDDIRFSPTIDTSTTHYDNNVPYYNPSKLYGPNGSYSVSKDGHMSVKSLESEGPLPGNWELVWEGSQEIVSDPVERWGPGQYRVSLGPATGVDFMTGFLWIRPGFSDYETIYYDGTNRYTLRFSYTAKTIHASDTTAVAYRFVREIYKAVE